MMGKVITMIVVGVRHVFEEFFILAVHLAD